MYRDALRPALPSPLRLARDRSFRHMAAMEVSSPEITIVGAGLVGSLLAVVLRSKGYAVRIYERYPDIRSIPSKGRSINLVATVRGLRALKALPDDVCRRLLELGTRVTGRIIHPKGGDAPLFQRYGKDDTEFNYSVSRYELNKFLISEAEAAGVELEFAHRLTAVDVDGERAKLSFAVGDGAKTVTCGGPLLACDGGGSGVRSALKATTDASEHLLASGYKEMLFPKLDDGLARHGLHIWPRGTHFIMALANLDGSFTGTIYMVNEGDGDTFASLETEEAAAAFLEREYADALPFLGGAEPAAKQLATNPRGLLGTVRTKRWTLGGKVALVGDAAHAIVPFFGQGMNSGFEDVDVLCALLAEHAPPGSGAAAYAAAFDEYERARKPNANAIADMALENYDEMMEQTADPVFRVRKAVENALENSALGAKFRSRYAMVCYGGGRAKGGVQYAHAQALGAVQWAIVSELAEGLEDPDRAAAHLDLAKAAALLEAKLAPLQEKLGVDLATISHHA